MTYWRLCKERCAQKSRYGWAFEDCYSRMDKASYLHSRDASTFMAQCERDRSRNFIGVNLFLCIGIMRLVHRSADVAVYCRGDI